MDEQKQLVCVFLSAVDQSAFCAYDKNVIYPVPNAWGKKGWTNIDLKSVKKTMLKDALTTSHGFVLAKATAPKKRAKK
jgi:hypothetical protein